MAGLGLHEASKYLPTRKLRRRGRGAGEALALGGVLVGATAPFIYDAYQAGKYIQEH